MFIWANSLTVKVNDRSFLHCKTDDGSGMTIFIEILL